MSLTSTLKAAGWNGLQDYVEHLAEKHKVPLDIARSLLYYHGLETLFTTFEDVLKGWKPTLH